MSRSKVFIYISIVVIIIAFGEYQKSQIEIKVSPIPPSASVEVKPFNTKMPSKPETQKLPESSGQQTEDQKEPEQADVVQPVEVKTRPVAVETKSTSVNNNFTKETNKIAQISPSDAVVDTYVPPIQEEKPPEIELYLPEKANLTKEEKIAEIRNLVTIFNAQLIKLYKDKEISYIPGDHKIEVLLGDSVEYYEDPIAFEKKSTSSFIKTTMTFIEDVQRLRKEAHQRYLKKNK